MGKKSNVASKWASKHLWGTIYFAFDGTCRRVKGCEVSKSDGWEETGDVWLYEMKYTCSLQNG